MSDRTDKNLAHLLSIDISHFPTAKLHQHDEAQLSYIPIVNHFTELGCGSCR